MDLKAIATQIGIHVASTLIVILLVFLLVKFFKKPCGCKGGAGAPGAGAGGGQEVTYDQLMGQLQ